MLHGNVVLDLSNPLSHCQEVRPRPSCIFFGFCLDLLRGIFLGVGILKIPFKLPLDEVEVNESFAKVGDVMNHL